jgi:hypothetical protein
MSSNIKLLPWNINQPKKITEGIKKTYFSFSASNRTLRTNNTEYHSIYRNSGMNLEVLKSNINNVFPFVYPVVDCFKTFGVKKVVPAPKGSRFEKNGFHFVTEILNKVATIISIEIFDIFINKKNKIILNGAAPDDDFFIFDDIVTFGTTIKNISLQVPRSNGIIILIANH